MCFFVCNENNVVCILCTFNIKHNGMHVSNTCTLFYVVQFPVTEVYDIFMHVGKVNFPLRKVYNIFMHVGKVNFPLRKVYNIFMHVGKVNFPLLNVYFLKI